ncbi:lethal(3)malignant brain tumor-like protein 3 isoform X1 [Anolis sagrei]|uniref:lethal(3)malignant brain tumor-like protein 3 isoform X1 n=1 Tax=Anolis sagrei TaxID=38937 RepID=UPI0035204942
MTEPASSGSGQDFDVFSVMDWKDGIGTLPGSDLKFRVNEFGALEVITDETEMENVKKATATTTWMVPTAQEVPKTHCSFHYVAFSEKTDVSSKLKEVDGLHFYENCFNSGTTVEYAAGDKACSPKCTHQIKNREQKEDKDISEFNDEDSSKNAQKRKIKLPPKLECIEDRNKKDKETEENPEGRVLRVSQRATRKRKRDMAVLKETLMSKAKKAWSWPSYLEEEKAIAAPLKIFKEYQSLPYNKNGFKVGMKLEGVDPEHQSMYCVLTVAETLGYRIRLHFDEYPDCYDFWLNADSSDIHPVGWCEKTGHKLHPPKGYKEDEFNWPAYLKKCKAQAAPKSLFENQNTTVIPSGFRVGMKLEAVDRKNPAFICVATVTDIVDSRFLVHFDNWDESYDYWCEAASPHIHPVGWCKEHRKTLITPPDYPHPKHFSWEKYLEETSSLPAPARAFKVKPCHGFQKNMKLEVVDKRNPVLIRVATIADTDDHRIKIHFDGWDSIYDYWIDADSPDIHPAGWCGKTGHPLQPPLSPLELVEALEQGICPTAGCKGIGHIKRARHMGHHSAISCPYSEINLNRERIFSDRLSGEMPLNNPPTHWNRKPEGNETSASPLINNTNCPSSIGPKSSAHLHSSKKEDTDGNLICKKPLICDAKEKNYRGSPTTKQFARKDGYERRKMESEEPSLNETKDAKNFNNRGSHSQAVILSSKLTNSSFPLRWEQQSKLLPSVAGIPASKVSTWSTDEVSEFIRSLPGCEEHGKVFKDEQIDGEAFLLMTQADIVKIMSIKLGPALKIFNSILMFKAADKNSHNEL